MSSSSSAKLVDCILALKSYHDWKQGGALGFWRLKSPSHPPVNMNKSVSKSSHSKSDNRSANAGIQWAIPDLDGTSVPSTFKQSTGFEYSGPFSGHTAFTSDPSGENNSPVGDAEEVASIDNSSAGTTTPDFYAVCLSSVGDPTEEKILCLAQNSTAFHISSFFCGHNLACIVQFPVLPGCNTSETNFMRFFK